MIQCPRLFRQFVLTVFLPVAVSTAVRAQESASLTVDTMFEGASARVLNVDTEQQTIHIMPGGDPQNGWPAWWCFRVTNLVKGQSFHVAVIGATAELPPGRPGAGRPLSPSWAMPTRAAWSSNGRQWQHTAEGDRQHGQIRYALTAAGPEMWIAWGPVATPSLVTDWVESAVSASEFATTFELATSRGGRAVRGIRVMSGTQPEQSRPVVWLQARQHAWESGSSWVAKGIMDWLTEDTPESSWLRSNTVVYVIPIMDVDRCATGDGGKESVPHDHNRDWSDSPHYPEVAAAQSHIRRWISQNRLAAFIDLHNPGPGNHEAFFFVAPDEVMTRQSLSRRAEFLDTVKASWDSPIPLDRETKSTGPRYHPLWQQISSNWVAVNAPNKTVSACLETAWNTPHSTTDGYRQTGAALAGGLTLFLQRNHSSRK